MTSLYRIVFLLSMSLIIVVHTNAQDKAAAILENFSEKTKQYEPFKADFQFKHLDREQNETSNMEGTVYMKNDMYKLNLPGSEIYSNGKNTWQYLEDMNEVTITKNQAQEGSLLNNPSEIFTLYKKDFKYKFHQETSINGKTYYEVDLFPKKPDEKNYSRIRLRISNHNMQLAHASIFGKDGTRIHINITSFSPNQDVGEEFFTFRPQKHPDVEINDMR